jgi:NAD(P)-dependent dehydrogenase (short-subunit alcohol dehydrogenase family)
MSRDLVSALYETVWTVNPENDKLEACPRRGMGEALEQLAAQASARRPATADEIAEAIVFLATDRACFIHGITLPVDGGRSAV